MVRSERIELEPFAGVSEREPAGEIPSGARDLGNREV
jgi:hypothetical protein